MSENIDYIANAKRLAATLLEDAYKLGFQEGKNSDNKSVVEFEQWWHEVGSGVTPKPHDDLETHTKNVARAAYERAGKA